MFPRTIGFCVIVNHPGGPWNQSVLKKTNQKLPPQKNPPKNQNHNPLPPKKTPNQPQKQLSSHPLLLKPNPKCFLCGIRLKLQNTADDTGVELLMSLKTMPLRGG